MRLLKLSTILLACVVSGSAFGAKALAGCVSVAKLVAYEGQVSIKPSGKVLKTSPGVLPRSLCTGDEVHTFEGRALLNDGRYTMAMEKFSVGTFTGAGAAGLNKGQALFQVRKGKAAAGVAIKTRLSVIGVKGTRFLVDDNPEGVGIVLDEGTVDIASTQGPVALYREKPVAKPTVEEDFESFIRQRAEGVAGMQAEYEEYKAQIQREFVAYVENLKLEAGKELVTVGKVAVERNISEQSAKAVQSLIEWQGKQ